MGVSPWGVSEMSPSTPSTSRPSCQLWPHCTPPRRPAELWPYLLLNCVLKEVGAGVAASGPPPTPMSVPVGKVVNQFHCSAVLLDSFPRPRWKPTYEPVQS